MDPAGLLMTVQISLDLVVFPLLPGTPLRNNVWF
jgi:hypothetical protein